MSRKVVKGFPTVVQSWRDLGREGHGGAYAGASPWARQGIFIMSSQQQGKATKESGPGLSISRRTRVENPNLKKKHRFMKNGVGICTKCWLLPEGHDRLMKTLDNTRKQ